MTDQKPFEHFWDEIIEYFDFEKVAKVMAFLGWGWTMHNGMKKGLAIPDENYLKEWLYKECREVYERGYTTDAGTGGFYITYDEDGMSVEFVLTSIHVE